MGIVVSMVIGALVALALLQRLWYRQIRSDLKMSEHECGSLKEHMKHLQSELQKDVDAIIRLQNELATRDAELAKLRGNVMAKTDVIRRQSDDIVRLESNIKTLQHAQSVRRSNRT